MSAENGVKIQKGPRNVHTAISTVVSGTGGEGYWISTINLPHGNCETLVFNVPTGAKIEERDGGNLAFSKPPLLKETNEQLLSQHNLTNIVPVEAARNHRNAVRKSATMLSRSNHR